MKSTAVASYAPNKTGGEVGGTLIPFSQPIKIESSATYVILHQDHDEICISEAQLQWALDALTRAAKALGWKEYQ
jgi:hypothetical protein